MSLRFSSSLRSLRIVGICLFVLSAGCGGGGNGLSPQPISSVNSIAFVSTRDGAPEIYRMNPDGSGQMRVTTGIGSADNPSQSRDGRIVFESKRDGNSEIYIVNRDGSGLQRLTDDAGVETFSDVQPVLSPDGKTIAWTSTRGDKDGLAPNIWLMDADGNNKRQFASGFATTAFPAWTADGQQIAYFIVPDRGGAVSNKGIQLKNVVTGQTTEPDSRIIGASHFRFDNGLKVIYSFHFARSPGNALATYDFATKTEGRSPILRESGTPYDRSPDYSPDGRSITWDATNDGKPAQIYRANADGSGVAALTSEGDNYSPDW